MKKFLALLVAFLLALGCLSACGNTEIPNTEVTTAPDGENLNSGVDFSNPSLTIDGEEIDTENLVFANIGGVDILFDEYRYMYLYLSSYYGMSSEYFAENPDVFAEFLRIVESYIVNNCWGDVLAKKYGITLTEEDNARIASELQAERDAFETEEEYFEALARNGWSEGLIERIITKDVLSERVYNTLYGENGQLLGTDDEIREDMKENYVKVYHLLISYEHYADDEAYSGLSYDEYKAEALKLANEYLTKIQNGEVSVYDAAQAVGDDPGMVDNKEGYFFTYNTMVKEFETASYDLEVGGISGLVETSYGWHIIEKLDHESYIDENFETLRGEYISTSFNHLVSRTLEEAEKTYFEGYEKIDAYSVK